MIANPFGDLGEVGEAEVPTATSSAFVMMRVAGGVVVVPVRGVSGVVAPFDRGRFGTEAGSIRGGTLSRGDAGSAGIGGREGALRMVEGGDGADGRLLVFRLWAVLPLAGRLSDGGGFGCTDGGT